MCLDPRLIPSLTCTRTPACVDYSRVFVCVQPGSNHSELYTQGWNPAVPAVQHVVHSFAACQRSLPVSPPCCNTTHIPSPHLLSYYSTTQPCVTQCPRDQFHGLFEAIICVASVDRPVSVFWQACRHCESVEGLSSLISYGIRICFIVQRCLAAILPFC